MNERNGRELTPEELAKAAGGYYMTSVTYATPEEVVFKWNIGSHVEKVRAYVDIIGHVFTKGCTVLDRKAGPKKGTDGYCAWYYVSSSDEDYNNKWFPEDAFEGGYDDIFVNNYC